MAKHHLTDQDKLLDAAYHEAGHVAIAHEHGVSDVTAETWPWPKYHQYRGRFSSRNRPKYIDQRASVAVAGMLAEAKFGAWRQECSARFAKSDIDSLVKALKEERSEDSPGEFTIEFVAESGNFLHQISGFSYSGSDKYDFVRHTEEIKNPANPVSVITNTMTLLDEPARWAAVERIAHKLAAQQPTSRRLEWDDIKPLLP